MVLPQATMIEVCFKVLCAGTVLPAVSFQLGTDSTSLSIADPDLSLSVNLDLSGETADSWITRTIPLSSYSATQLRSMKVMAFDVDCIAAVTATSPRLEMTAYTVLPSNDNGVTFIVDYISVDVTGSKFTPGAEYQFCYSYEWVDGEGTATQSASSPVSASFTIGGTVYNLTMALAIACEVLAESDFGNEGVPDNIILYARGGSIGSEFHKIAAIVLGTLNTGSVTVFSYNWDGSFTNNPELVILPNFTPAPIAGCSLITEHRGRMIYAKGDVLYISNWDEPDKVPGEATVAQATTDGTWVRVGLDGSPIVGLGKLGSYLVIFKMRSCYMLEGDDLSTFTLVQISATHGCSSHESIAQLDGSMLVWRDGEHVWAWDGQQFSDIARPIRNLLKEHSLAQQMNSISCFDPLQRLYLLTVPGSGDLAATTYSFEMLSSCWNPVWTAQPGSALCFAQTVKVAGLYAVDTAGVFRLFMGTVDALTGSTSQNIDFSWVSGAIEEPYPGRYKDVRAIHAVMSYEGRQLTSLDFALRVNGAATDRSLKSAIAVKPLAGSPGVASWLPKPLSDVDAFAVKVAGSSSTGGEIARIELLVGAKGVSR